MVVSENYPNLKANQGFQDLRVQLEGTENRITVARNRYIKAVADYNVLARSFPTNLTAMMFGYEVKPTFTVQNEAQISAPPAVRLRQARAAASSATARWRALTSLLLRRWRRWPPVLAARVLRRGAGAARAGRAAGAAADGRVIDQTGTLTSRSARRSSGKLADFERETGTQIVVLMVPTTRPKTSRPTRSASPTSGRSAGATSATAC